MKDIMIAFSLNYLDTKSADTSFETSLTKWSKVFTPKQHCNRDSTFSTETF